MNLFSLPRAFARLERRVEEIVAYFAIRSPQRHQVRSAYLGDHTALALMHGVFLMYVDTRGVDIASHLMIHGDWEPDDVRLFARMIRPGDTVLDVGSHLGVYAVVGSHATGPTGRVHSFEPNSRLAELQRLSVLANGYGERAMVHQVAVGATEGIADLVFSHEWAGGGHLAEAGAQGQGERVRVIALDEIFTDPAFRIDVMKMDVEGTEGFALTGMQQILARSPNARLMMEFAPELMAARGFPAPAVVQLLAGLGFRFWTIGPGGALAPASAESLSAMGGGIRNIVAARGEPLG